MAGKATKGARRNAAERPDMYQTVTDAIVAMLDSGTVPWQKPWHSQGRRQEMPRNVRGTRYRGINVWILAMTGYRSPIWMTFKQALALGGHVRRGETSTEVVLWKPTKRRPTGEEAEAAAANGEEARDKTYLLIRSYRVFNLAQVSLPGHALWKLGGRFPSADADQRGAPFQPIAEAAALAAGMPDAPPVAHGGDRAYYVPLTDRIQMPPCEAFHTPEHYYATLFHEMAHSTGAEKRLNRKSLVDAVRFGDTNYSEEELIAEFASAFLAAEAGISPAVVSNSAAYIAGWRQRFKDDPKMVVMAAQRAQRAADWILGVTAAQAAAAEETEETPADAASEPQEALAAAA